MKVAFITPSVSRSSGGIFEVELALAKSLTDIGCEVQVYGQKTKIPDTICPDGMP